MTDEHRQFLDDTVAADGLEALVQQKEREIALGLTLFDLRTEAGLTQQALAKVAGVRQGQISRWDSDGIAESTQMDTILRVFSALGASITLHFHKDSPPNIQVVKGRREDAELLSARKAVAKAAEGKNSTFTLRVRDGQKVVVKLVVVTTASRGERPSVRGTVAGKPKGDRAKATSRTPPPRIAQALSPVGCLA